MPNANWSNPTLTSTYTNFVSEVKNRDEDLALQFDGTTSTNIPTNAIRWDSSAGRWKKWNGSAWAELAATYALTGLTTTGNATFNGLVQCIGANTAGLTNLFQLKTGSGNVYGLQVLGNYTTEDYLIQNYYNGYLAFGTNNNERLRITSGGLVGIGTNSPNSPIHIKGGSITTSTTASDFIANSTARLVVGHANEYGVYIGYTNSVNDAVAIQSSTNAATVKPLLLNPYGGNVGIGTSSPATVLTLRAAHATATATTYTGALLIHDEPNGVAPHLGFGVAYASGAQHAWIQSNSGSGVYPLVLQPAGGNVGIETTTPRGNLSIANDTTGATVSTSLHLGYSTSDFYGFRLVNTNNPSNTAAGTFTIQRGTVAAWIDALTVDNNGLVTAASGLSGAVTRATAVATTSGTSVSFTSLPTWVKRISIHFSGVSLSGTDHLLVRLSTGAAFATTGYTSSSNYTTVGGGTGGTSSTVGFALFAGNTANLLTGTYTFTNITGNTWVGTGGHIYDNDGQFVGNEAGKITLGGTLDGIRLLPTGANTFDAGTVNITYEG